MPLKSSLIRGKSVQIGIKDTLDIKASHWEKKIFGSNKNGI